MEIKTGISIQSQHGFVNTQYHQYPFQGIDDIDSKYITTITGPDKSIMHIITDSKAGMDSYARRLMGAIYLVLENNPMWADVIHAMKDAQDNRRKTALDEVKTADLWAKSEPRYWVTLIADEVDGYSEVPITLFHTEMSNEELARLVVLAPGRSIDDVAHWYTASAIEQTFSKAEVKQLYAYFKQRGNVRLGAHRAYSPTNAAMGVGAIPVGGGNDFYTFSEEPGYSLPFKVWGYFDLR
ncbi:unnamed protein product, partial [marine sediment metagenome]